MSIIFFLSIFTLFLFFFANFILSPEKNPRFVKMMASEHAPSEETITILAGTCNLAAMALTVMLVAVVPFFRAVAAIVMLGLVVRFFSRRLRWGPRPESKQDPSPARHVGNHSESDK